MAFVSDPGRASELERDLEAFRRVAGGRAVARLETATRHVLVALPRADRLDTDPTGRMTVAWCGSPPRRSAAGPACSVLGGTGTVSTDLDGPFAGVAVDGASDRISIVTDRANFIRVFHAPVADGHWFGTSLWDLPVHAFAVDPTAVGWYLSNGVVHAGRSPYRGIRALSAAGVHDVEPGGLRTRTYWRYGYFTPDRAFDDAAGLEDLKDRIVAAVRRQCEGAGDVWLSLSGGYDSTAIALILARELGRSDVRCLSYATGPLEEGSDAAAAAEQAARLGFSHTVYEGYAGDLIAHLRGNAARGEGVAHRCDELDAWLALGLDVAAAQDGVLLVGDHFLGGTPETREKRERESPPGGLWSMDVVSWLSDRVDPEVWSRLEDGVRTDIDGLLEPYESPDRARGPLYFSQRLGNTLFPWRQRFVPPGLSVRWPLMGNDVLDYVSAVPRSVRATQFYHRALKRAFPDVLDRPVKNLPGYYLDLGREFTRHRDRVAELVRAAPSRLDELLPPDLALDVLGRVVDGPSLGRRILGRSKRMVGRIAGQEADGGGPAGRTVSEAELLRRLLILREALGGSGTPRNPTPAAPRRLTSPAPS